MGAAGFAKHRGRLAIALVAALAALAADAAAQSASAQAEALFRQGKDLMAAGKLADACAAFDASDKLDPAISTLLNAANCREKNNQLETAWGLFVDAERQTRTATDPATQRLHQTAAEHAAKLESRLSTLTITVPAASRVDGLEILRDRDSLDLGVLDRPLPIDGGTYTITARAPGNAAWSTTVTVGVEHDVQTIEIPQLKSAGLSELKPAVVTPPPVVDHREPDVEIDRGDARHRRHLIGIGIGGVGIAAIATGAILALDAKHKWNEAGPHCDASHACDPTGLSINQSARSLGNVATVVAGIGLAATAVGVVLYVTAPASRSITEHAVIDVVPQSSTLRVMWSGRF